MKPELYFLRSSEKKIVDNMCKYAHTSQEKIKMYSEYYGLKTTDLGLYALVDASVVGAIWCRKIENIETPLLSIVVLPEFRRKGIATFMMDQFLLEAGAVYKKLSIETYEEENLQEFLMKFGFNTIAESSIFSKTLEYKEIVRPSDGYDAQRWMD